MSIIDSIASWLRVPGSAYPASEVAKAASEMQEPVLWAGPAFLPASVHETLVGSAWALMAVIVLIPLGLSLALWGAKARTNKWKMERSVGGAVLILCGIFAALMVGQYQKEATDKERQAYVITPTRLVSLGGPARRTDHAATAVVQVDHFAEGHSRICLIGRPDCLRVETTPEDRARFQQAADRLIRREASN